MENGIRLSSALRIIILALDVVDVKELVAQEFLEENAMAMQEKTGGLSYSRNLKRSESSSFIKENRCNPI